MSISEIKLEHQRLVILRLLNETPGFDLNESMLQDALDVMGLDISRDALKVQSDWLAEMGLVTIESILKTRVLKLTGRGEDVAVGRAVVSGIKRPRAGD